MTEALLAALDRQGTVWWLKEADGRYRRLSAGGHALFGLAQGMALGLTDADLLPHVQAASLRAADQVAWTQAGPVVGTHQIDAGGERWALGAVRAVIPSEPGGQPLLLGLWFDARPLRQCGADLRAALVQLEQQQRANEELRAQLDASGSAPDQPRLLQREPFEECLRREVDLSQREHRDLALAWVVIDEPPPGTPNRHAAGRERVQQALGELLRANTRAMDACCRIDGERGGARFGVLLSGVGLATAYARMESLRAQCATQRVPVGGEALRFTVSMGVASFPHSAATLAGIMEAAEAALVQAQGRGGDRVTLAGIPFEDPAVG